jgi:Tol biopolymer transport system component
VPSDATSGPKRLESWKEIAAYINRDVRTARRWENERDMPVHRVPGKRSGVYALSAEIDLWLKADTLKRTAATRGPSPGPGTLRRPSRWAAVSAVGTLVVAALGTLMTARPAVPQLRHAIAITNDGSKKTGLFGRAGVLYFLSSGNENGYRQLMRIASGGSERTITSFGSSEPEILDVSRDGSEALVCQHSSESCRWPLWVVPTTGGPPTSLGELCAQAAAWSPDGRRLAFVSGRDLFLANPDGTGSHRLLGLPFDLEGQLVWSLDGNRLRMVLREGRSPGWLDRLWQVTIDQSRATRVLPGWSRTDSDQEHSGQWTCNGSLFIFTASHQGTKGIWVIREGNGLFDWWSAAPIQLTSAPESLSCVTLNPDGKNLFALVELPRRGELLRLEPTTGQFVRYTQMQGLSAAQLAFSPDGQRVAYMTYPESKLWTMNRDGSNRQPLTPGDRQGALPQWSPDGRRIAYVGGNLRDNGPTKIRVVSSSGQDAAEPIQWPTWQGAPQWASDTELIFGENGPTLPIPASCALHSFDFKTGTTTDLLGTTGLWTARVCPTGRYIAAQTRDNRKLVLYDRRTAKLTELLSSPEGALGDNPAWSKDGRFIYMDMPFAQAPAIYRIRIRDKRIERVASLAGIQRVSGGVGLWIGLTPDGSLLVLRELQGSEIYAWDWVAP